MSSPQAQATARRAGLRDQMDAFWDRLVDAGADPRRAYPRVRMDTPVTVRINDEEIEIRLHDISRGGLQARCDRPTRARIAPTSTQPRIAVGLALTLRDGGDTRPLQARGTLVHVTLLEQQGDEVALGFCFEGLDANACRALEWFITRALEPAP